MPDSRYPQGHAVVSGSQHLPAYAQPKAFPIRQSLAFGQGRRLIERGSSTITSPVVGQSITRKHIPP